MPTTSSPTRSVVIATFATVMLAAAVAQGFGRFTFGVVLPDVREDLFGGSNSLGGFVATANTFAYLVGALVVGSLSAKVSPVNSVRIGLLFSVGGLAAAAAAPNTAVLTLAMISMGFGGAAIWIPSPGITSAVVAPHLRGLAVGLTGSGVGLGIIFSGQLNGRLVANGGGWRDVYTVHTVIGLVAIALVFLVLRQRRSDGTTSRRFWGLRGVADPRRVETHHRVLFHLRLRLPVDPGVSDLATPRRQRLQRVEQRAPSLPSPAAAPSLAAWRWAVSPTSSAVRWTLVGSFPLWAAAVGLILTGELPLVIVGAVIVGFLFGGIPSVIAAYLVDRTDAATYGPSYAAATFAFGVAQVSSPQIGGFIADWRGSFTLVFVMSAVVMSSGALFAWALPSGS